MSLFNPVLVLSDYEPCQCENCKKKRQENQEANLPVGKEDPK
jgi:hypothetical protein